MNPAINKMLNTFHLYKQLKEAKLNVDEDQTQIMNAQMGNQRINLDNLFTRHKDEAEHARTSMHGYTEYVAKSHQESPHKALHASYHSLLDANRPPSEAQAAALQRHEKHISHINEMTPEFHSKLVYQPTSGTPAKKQSHGSFASQTKSGKSGSSMNKNTIVEVETTTKTQSEFGKTPEADGLSKVIVDRGDETPAGAGGSTRIGGGSTGGKVSSGGRPSYKGTDLSMIRGGEASAV